MKLTEPQRTAIFTVYAQYFQAADEIVADPELAAEYLGRVNAKLSEAEHLAQVVLNKNLINLRKKGEAKGGLPRKHRDYNGRNVSQSPEQ